MTTLGSRAPTAGATARNMHAPRSAAAATRNFMPLPRKSAGRNLVQRNDDLELLLGNDLAVVDELLGPDSLGDFPAVVEGEAEIDLLASRHRPIVFAHRHGLAGVAVCERRMDRAHDEVRDAGRHALEVDFEAEGVAELAHDLLGLLDEPPVLD